MTHDRDKKRKRAAKTRGDENIIPKHENWEDILMDEFLENLTMASNSDIEFRVRVDTEDFVSLEESPGERARAIALLMSDVMGLHWT
ncbi:MAG TPA: hypothetical protein VGO47_08790 [Chlamydiales bacterium]|jgi:hypothetical protein|nr:hypothetical protein [Chlamydiales bacterium]